MTSNKKSQSRPTTALTAVIFALLLSPAAVMAQDEDGVHHRVDTYVGISICNNGVVDPGELCDSGLGSNDGAYSSSTAGRHCAPGCRAWGPYCGDGVLKAYYGEECTPTGADDKFCNMQCKQLSVPVSSSTPPNPPPQPSGSGGGSSGNVNIMADTKVVVTGKAYPNARVQILKDAQLLGITNAGSDANFRYEVVNATPGPTTLAFWSEDSKQTRSITTASSFQVTQNAVTYVNNIFLPPTIRAKVAKVGAGEKIHFEGTTVPSVTANIVADREKVPRAMSTTTSSGDYAMDVSTDGLVAEARHQFFPFFTITSGSAEQRSPLGLALSIFTGTADVKGGAGGAGDINGDLKVNLTDLSIMLGHWGVQFPQADLNGNGRVDISDLSILLAHWTG